MITMPKQNVYLKKQTKNHITQEFYSLYRNIIIFVTCHNWLESPKR